MHVPTLLQHLMRATILFPLLCVMACCAWADAGNVAGHYVRTTRSPVFLAGNSETGELVLSPGPQQRMRFALAVTWAPHPNDGAVTHEGRVTGELTVKNNVAVFVEVDTDCILVFQLQPNHVVVTLFQRCLFGANMDASGTYTKKIKP
jgi:hypothetical protein